MIGPLLDPSARFTARNDPEGVENAFKLMELSDGSFLTFTYSHSVQRWSRATSTSKFDYNDESCKFVVVGTYEGHDSYVSSAAEKDDNTIVTGSDDSTLRVWNKTTCECLLTIALSDSVSSIQKTRDASTLVCGFQNGSVEFRRLSDLEVDNTIQLKEEDDEYRDTSIHIYGELEDGTFILAEGSRLQRWDISNQTLLQTFTGHKGVLFGAIVLNRDIIVIASEIEATIWRVSTGELLQTLRCLDCEVEGIVKLTERHFAIGSTDKMIRLWDEHGYNYATYPTEDEVQSMTVLADGSIVTLEHIQFEDENKILVIRKT